MESRIHDISSMEDEVLLNFGLMVLHEILQRRLHMNTGGIVPKKKSAPRSKKGGQPPIVIGDEEIGVMIDGKLCLDAVEENIASQAYDSPPPLEGMEAREAPGAPKKKKAPSKGKQASANEMFKVEECN